MIFQNLCLKLIHKLSSFFWQFAIVPCLVLQMKSVTKMTDDVFAQKVSTGSNVNLEVSKRGLKAWALLIPRIPTA